MRKLEENIQNLEGKAKSKDQICRNHKDKVNELELHLESKTELCRQLEKQSLQLSEEVKKKDEIGSTLQQKVGSLMSYFYFTLLLCRGLPMMGSSDSAILAQGQGTREQSKRAGA